MTHQTDDGVLAKMRKAKNSTLKSLMPKKPGKYFEGLVAQSERIKSRSEIFEAPLKRAFEKIALDEKESLELARLDLRTACRRLQDAHKLFKALDGMIQWEVSMSILTKAEKLLDGAWIEIERAGKTVKP